MDKEIIKIVNKVLSEEISNNISKFKYRLFEDEEVNDKKVCESCGGETNEANVCEECGSMYEGDIQELGGMDDGHPKFGHKRFPKKMSPEEIDDLLRGDENNDDEDYKDLSMNNPYYGVSKTFDDYDDYPDEDYDDKFDKESQEIKRIDRELGKGETYNEGFPKWEKLKKHMDDRDKKQIDDRNENMNNLMRQIKDEDGEEGFPKWEKLKKHMDDRNKKRDGELGERLYGNQSRIDKNKNNRIDSEDFKMLRKETYELTLNGVNKKFIFNENEIIDIIENIVLEEKKKAKIKKTKNNPIKITKTYLDKSKKENDSYIDSVVKKMKDYLKTGSKGVYDMNPKHFPKGNGELAKMDKMAYKASNDVEEYIDNFTAAGLENLDYDEIKPNEDWVTDNIVGSSKTGNNPKWANAVETPNNKKRNTIRKNNLLSVVKSKAYNKASQPVENEPRSKKTHDILTRLESIENASVIAETKKINNLMGYNVKTQ